MNLEETGQRKKKELRNFIIKIGIYNLEVIF